MGATDMRREYSLRGLSESDLSADPIEQFRAWLDDAAHAGMIEPNAMTLATCTPDGRPSARMVLLKGLDARGFVYYTNYESRKGQELASNPWAALVFYWDALERQVRVEGSVTRVSESESDAYFTTRPRGSRLGAFISPQSQVVASREQLERRLAEAEQAFPDDAIPRPKHWGGFRVTPSQLEFWQGRPNRLHDRLRYRRMPDSSWLIERLGS